MVYSADSMAMTLLRPKLDHCNYQLASCKKYRLLSTYQQVLATGQLVRQRTWLKYIIAIDCYCLTYTFFVNQRTVRK